MNLFVLLIGMVIFVNSVLFSQQPSWRLVPATAGNPIAALDMYKGNSDTMYAIGINNFMRSINRGEHWDSVAPLVALEGAIKIHPQNSKKIYLSHAGVQLQGNDVSISTDGGETWERIFLGRAYTTAIIEFDPLDYRTVYVGVGPSNLYRSTDEGITWDLLNRPPVADYLKSLVINPKNDSILYMSYLYGIYKSTDSGSSWEKLSLGVEVQRGAKLAIDFTEPNIVYAGLYSDADTIPGGIYKSTDGGRTWSEKNDGLTLQDRRIHVLSINPKDHNDIFMGISTGYNGNLLYRSTDGANHWVPFSNGLPTEGSVISVVIDSSHNKMYAGAFGFRDLAGIYILDTLSTSVVIVHRETPHKLNLYQNFPNPFNPKTKIRFKLNITGLATLKVYDIFGYEVSSLLNEKMEMGEHEVDWNPTGFASGVYYYRLTIYNPERGLYIETKKMLLLK